MKLPLTVRMGTECAVHRHTEWVPTNRHHVWPLGLGGPDHPSNIAVVCMNGHGAVHSLMDRMLVTPGGALPWSVRRMYGRRVRAMALAGYALAVRNQTDPVVRRAIAARRAQLTGTMLRD